MSVLEKMAGHRVRRELTHISYNEEWLALDWQLRRQVTRGAGFMSTLKRALFDAGAVESQAFRKNDQELCGIGIVPDLWAIARNDRTTVFVACEIEDSNPITENKLQQYVWLWEQADATTEVDVVVVAVDRYGTNQRLVDLFEASHFFLAGESDLAPQSLPEIRRLARVPEVSLLSPSNGGAA